MSKLKYKATNIRAFIGAKDYSISRRFYNALGFKEAVIDEKMSLFKVNGVLAFYLQDYYVKNWINNSMIFLEVEDINICWQDLQERNLLQRFKGVRLSEVKTFEWGKECFLHDPSGVLWHFGQFH